VKIGKYEFGFGFMEDWSKGVFTYGIFIENTETQTLRFIPLPPPELLIICGLPFLINCIIDYLLAKLPLQ